MAQPQLRPLGIGEVIDVSFTILRRRFAQMVTIAALVTVPFGLAQALATPDALSSPALQTGEFTEQDIENLKGLFELDQWVPFLIFSLLGGLASLIATGALTSVVADEYLDAESTWRGSIREGIRRLPRILGALLLLFLLYVGAVLIVILLALVIGGFVVLVIIAGVVFAFIAGVSISLFIPALVVEDLSPWESFRRSWNLTSGRRWPIFGALLLALVVVSIAGAIVQGVAVLPFPSSQQFAVSTIASVMSGIVTTPFVSTVNTVIYFDQRVRKEAFDLELLADQLGTSRERFQAAAPPTSDFSFPPPSSPDAPSSADLTEPPDDATTAWPPPVDG